MHELGADEVLIGPGGLDRPSTSSSDSVGGPQLVTAWSLLAPRRQRAEHRLDLRRARCLPALHDGRPGQSLTLFVIEGNAGPDLATLTELAAEGALTVEIGWQDSWSASTRRPRRFAAGGSPE
ncbi:hypothetical protein ACWC09_39820 [Streptomyces sp. NPDC001617]